MRCMRAGAREFLTEPVLPGTVGEALVRASVRRDEVRRHKKATGKLLVCLWARRAARARRRWRAIRGGLGESSPAAKWRLLDLDLQLGDAASDPQGLTTKFTALDALENTNAAGFGFSLGSDGTKHDSGLAVLGCAGYDPAFQPSKNGMEKLFRVAREDFEYRRGGCRLALDRNVRGAL